MGEDVTFLVIYLLSKNFAYIFKKEISWEQRLNLKRYTA